MLPLALDTFAVSAALGLAGLDRRGRIQASVLFPAVETAMPVAGLALGHGLARAIGQAAEYVGALVVAAAGAWLLGERDAAESRPLPVAGGWALVALGLGISVDELALGLGIGLLRLSFAAAVIMIAVQAIVASQLGLLVGRRLGARGRVAAERLAGVALLALGLVLFFERLAR